VDAPGDLAKLVAERVAVNARQAGVSVQVLPRPSLAAQADPAAALHLFAWHVSSLSPRLELDALLKSMTVKESSASDPSATDAAQLFARERRILEDRYLLPIVVLPEYAGLNANVRNWLPSRWGEWHLADVWLDSPDVAEVSERPAAADSSPATVLASG